MNQRRRAMRRALARASLLVLVASVVGAAPTVTAQEGYQRISGEGSSWAANAIDAMRVNVQQYGITVDYNPSGSTSGRKNFLNGTVDFAASDIPFQFEPEDGSASENPAPGSYAYIPVTAGGTSFMYNLKINGQPVTNLRLSGENVAKIFTASITMWNDPAIQADNPGLVMPARQIVPVVRSDGSGSTAQFTQWMINRHPQIWNEFCDRSGRAPACGFTSFYPEYSGIIAQSGDLGVAGYVSQNFAEGAIGYVNYSYALNVEFPVAKVLNAAGYYTEPTPENVAVSLLQARINTDESNPSVYLTQDLTGVYSDADPRNYQLSSYSYFILPTRVAGQFNEAKGRTLGAFAYYAMCQAQQQSASLGYSPLPINLVEASLEQIRKIPGVEVQNINITACDNPTFSPDGTNELANNAPRPQECDRQGAAQCPDGTAGMRNVPTAVSTPTNNNGGGGGAVDNGGGGAVDNGAGAVDNSGGGGAVDNGGSGGAVDNGGGGGSISSAGAGSGSGSGSGSGAGTGSGSSTGTGTGTPQINTGEQPPTGQLDQSGGAVVAGPATGDGSSAVCDPDTGICGGGAVVDAAGNVVPQANNVGNSSQSIGPIATTTLDAASKWGSVQLLILVGVLIIGLVVAPVVAWQRFSLSRVP